MIWAVSWVLAAGLSLPEAPPIAPGRFPSPASDPIAAAKVAAHLGDDAGVARAWRAALARGGLDESTRAAAWFAIGHAEARRGELAAASAAYAGAIGGTAISSEAAFRKAQVDAARGAALDAARECALLRATWPSSPRAPACLMMEGEGLLAGGQNEAAIDVFRLYMRRYGGPAAEIAALGIATATARMDPAAGAPLLIQTALFHEWHPTGQAAEAELARMGLTIPDELPNRQARAEERLRCGARAEAWSMYSTLAADPESAGWAEDKRPAFVYGTRRWRDRAADLAKEESALAAKERARALGRAGDWAEAADAYGDAIARFGAWGVMDGAPESQARATLLAGNWEAAVPLLDALRSDEGTWLAALAATFGRHPDAEARLDAIPEGPYRLGATYWRARLAGLRGDGAAEAQALAAIAAAQPTHWYGLLAKNRLEPGAGRGGRWPMPRAEAPAADAAVVIGKVSLPVPARARGRAPLDVDWSGLRPREAEPAEGVPLPVVSVPQEERGGLRATLEEGEVRSGIAALRALVEATEDEGALAAALLFTDAGLPTLAGPALKTAVERMGEPRLEAPGLTLTAADWMRIFLVTEDGWDGVRFARRVMAKEEKDQLEGPPLIDDPWRSTEVRALAPRALYPTPWLSPLTRHGAAYDLDPLLALAIMRQESTYRPDATSHAGALGLIQVMPRTGARIATLLSIPRYSPVDLLDPDHNLRYGSWYLAALLGRFDDSVPLAVAAYNGGPHNVASWLATWPQGLDTDQFVELIPFAETRDYVERVTGWYAESVARYAAPGSRVVLPRIAHDAQPDGIDF